MAYNRVITWGRKISIGLRKSYASGRKALPPQCKPRGSWLVCKRNGCQRRFYVHRYRADIAMYCSIKCSAFARVGSNVKPASDSRKRKIRKSNIARWTPKLRREKSVSRKRFLKSLSPTQYDIWIDNVMKAKRRRIPWNGELFRSWWEAKFSSWLNARKVNWLYERVRFKLGPRKSYTPDFYLPSAGIFVEIKGDLKDTRFWKKLSLLNSKFPDVSVCILGRRSLKSLGVI